MSIQGAFLSSLTSLNAQQAQIGTISQNVANATTSGYSAEDVPLSAIVYNNQGGGVAAGSVQRATNAALTAANNQAGSAQAYSARMTSVLGGYSAALSQGSAVSSDSADTTTSNVLSSAMTGMNAALTALSASPGDTATQAAALQAAHNLADGFNTLDAAIATGRETADAGIASDVASVNTSLTTLAANEAAIKKATALGQSTAGLEDTRDKLVADIAGKIPVHVLANGSSIVLTTDGGTTLYDGVARQLSFTGSPNIPDSLRATVPPTAGGLSGVTVDGRPIAISQNGSIAANLQLRDVTLTGYADQLNQLAGNVIGAFQSADPSVSSGQAGLFTVNGGPLTASTPTTDLAGSIAVNASADPEQGGAVWRMQFGAQAASAGGASDTSTTLGLLGAMNAAGSYDPASGLPASSSMLNAASQVAGLQQSTYATWSARNDTRVAQSQTAQTALSNATGVNVDEQMQRLLLIQQTYAASAQVIQAASQMLSTMNSVAASAVG